MGGGRRLVVAVVIAVAIAAPARRAAAQHSWCSDPDDQCAGKPRNAQNCCPVATTPHVTTPTVVDVPIATTPAGATVSIDGKVAGTSPLTAKLARGEHVVVLELEGYRTSETSVHVSTGEAAHLSVTLVAEARGPCPDAAACTRRCDAHNARACADVGVMYLLGQGAAKDPVK